MIQDIGHEDQLLSLAWKLVNDSLRTDVCLLYPPYQIAIGMCILENIYTFLQILAIIMYTISGVCFLGCLQIACVIQQKDGLKSWFAELNVDIDKIQEITRYIVNLFDLWKSYDEKKDISALLAKMPKPKTQSNR